jgi:hypothetical protein
MVDGRHKVLLVGEEAVHEGAVVAWSQRRGKEDVPAEMVDAKPITMGKARERRPGSLNHRGAALLDSARGLITWEAELRIVALA